MEYVINGASIECAAASIVSRKIERTGVQNNPKLGLCKKYKCSRNSEAKISKELSPKKALLNPSSLLDLHDKISGETISILTSFKKDLCAIKAPNTGRHKAQFTDVDGFTQAIIVVQFPNLSEIKDPNQLKALMPKMESLLPEKSTGYINLPQQKNS